MLNDVRYALRLLRRSTGFAAAAVGTLALGIGATTAIFAVFEAVVLTPLPIDEPEAVVSLHRQEGQRLSRTFVYPATERFREQTTDVFSAVVASGDSAFRVRIANSTHLASATFITPGYFELLGVDLSRGRRFTAEDHARGASPAVILTDAFWRARLGADPAAVGSEIRVADAHATIIGIAPRGFRGLEIGSPTDMFLPLMATAVVLPAGNYLSDTTEMVGGLGYSPQAWLDVTARLKPGVSVAQAEARLAAVTIDRVPARTPSSLRLVPTSDAALSPGTRTDTTRFAALLAAVVSLVLLIGCANLAGLVLARNEQRRREIAVRLALGARASRVVRLFLTESVLLSALGGAAGVLVALWMLQVMSAFVIPGSIELETLQLGLTRQVLVFALVAAVFTSVVTGFLPAIAGSRLDLVSALKDRAGLSGRGSSFLRGTLVAAQVAVSLVLIIGASLFARSVRTALATDVGADVSPVAYVTVSLWGAGYDDARRAAFNSAMVERLGAMPGVEGASFGGVPLAGFPGSTPGFRIDGVQRRISQTLVFPGGPDYFATVGIPVVSGRVFGRSDHSSRLPVAVVNEAFAREVWPGANPIGRRIADSFRDPDLEVIGVVRDGKYGNLREQGRLAVYVPAHLQRSGIRFSETFFVRTAGDPGAAIPLMQQVVRQLDPGLAITAAGTMTERIAELAMTQRIGASLLGWFSVVAFALAVLGVYGLIAYAVTRRTNEIGIRMALGGTAGDVVRLMMRRALTPVAIGTLAGLGGAYVLTRFATSFLFGIQPHDPLSFAAGGALLLVGVALASYLPARRAARVDPVVALRAG
jgi:predicted permease